MLGGMLLLDGRDRLFETTLSSLLARLLRLLFVFPLLVFAHDSAHLSWPNRSPISMPCGIRGYSLKIERRHMLAN